MWWAIARSARLRRWHLGLGLVAVGALGAGLSPLGAGLWPLASSPDEGSPATAVPATAVPAAGPHRLGWRALAPVRGRILDRNGAALAASRRTVDVYVVPRRFTAEVRTQLIELLALSDQEVARLDLRTRVGDEAERAVLALPDATPERVVRIARAGLELGGAVELRDGSRRDYPGGELASHLLGYLGPPTADERAELEREGFTADELIGRSGIERAFERALHGTPGIAVFAEDDRGVRLPADEVAVLIGVPPVEPPVAGDDVVLTIDLELQKVVAKAIRSHTAAAVAVVEVETGRILALSSTPSLDPAALAGQPELAEPDRLGDYPLAPLVDRSFAQPYPPASTFKLVTAIAGLEAGAVAPADEVTCTGQRTVGRRVLRDMDVHGTLDFVAAMQRSCNVYFWAVAERVGLARLVEVARDLGFGAPTGLGLDREAAGQLPDPTPSGQPERDLLATLNTAVGAGAVKVTVVQVAMAYAALANGGRLYAPQVVRRVQTARGRVVDEREPILRRRIAASPATLATIREGMWRAVNTRGGTAFAARRGKVRMIGKTGTTEVANAHYRSAQPSWDPILSHAWFVGWAPARRPQIALVVLIEHGGIGGEVAAPVARAIVDDYFTRARPGRPRTGRR